jgi:hypothetical protein
LYNQTFKSELSGAKKYMQKHQRGWDKPPRMQAPATNAFERAGGFMRNVKFRFYGWAIERFHG